MNLHLHKTSSMVTVMGVSSDALSEQIVRRNFKFQKILCKIRKLYNFHGFTQTIHHDSICMYSNMNLTNYLANALF